MSLINFITRFLFKNVSNKRDFGENWLNDSPTLLRCIDIFMHIHAVCLDRFVWNLVEEVSTSCHLEVIGFVKIGVVKATIFFGEPIKIFRVFWFFLPFDNISVHNISKENYLWRRVSRKSVRESHALRSGFNEFYTRTFRIYFSTRVKSSIRDLYKILFSILEFRRP
jgi:hypothetical protein